MAQLIVRKYVCQQHKTHEGIDYLEVCPECYAPIVRTAYKVLKRIPKEVWGQVVNCRKSSRQTFLIRQAAQDPNNVPVEIDFPSDPKNQIPVCSADPTHQAFNPVRLPVCKECGWAVEEVLLAKVESGHPRSNAYKAWLKVRGKYFKQQPKEEEKGELHESI